MRTKFAAGYASTTIVIRNKLRQAPTQREKHRRPLCPTTGNGRSTPRPPSVHQPAWTRPTTLLHGGPPMRAPHTEAPAHRPNDGALFPRPHARHSRAEGMAAPPTTSDIIHPHCSSQHRPVQAPPLGDWRFPFACAWCSVLPRQQQQQATSQHAHMATSSATPVKHTGVPTITAAGSKTLLAHSPRPLL